MKPSRSRLSLLLVALASAVVAGGCKKRSFNASNVRQDATASGNIDGVPKFSTSAELDAFTREWTSGWEQKRRFRVSMQANSGPEFAQKVSQQPEAEKKKSRDTILRNLLTQELGAGEKFGAPDLAAAPNRIPKEVKVTDVTCEERVEATRMGYCYRPREVVEEGGRGKEPIKYKEAIQYSYRLEHNYVSKEEHVYPGHVERAKELIALIDSGHIFSSTSDPRWSESETEYQRQSIPRLSALFGAEPYPPAPNAVRFVGTGRDHWDVLTECLFFPASGKLDCGRNGVFSAADRAAAETRVRSLASTRPLETFLWTKSLGLVDLSYEDFKEFSPIFEARTYLLTKDRLPAKCRLVEAMGRVGMRGAQELDKPDYHGFYVDIERMRRDQLGKVIHRIVKFMTVNQDTVMAKFSPAKVRWAKAIPLPHQEKANIREALAQAEKDEVAPIRSIFNSYDQVNFLPVLNFVAEGKAISDNQNRFQFRLFDAAYLDTTRPGGACQYLTDTVEFSAAVVRWAESF